MNIKGLNYKKVLGSKFTIIAVLVCIISVVFIGANMNDLIVAGDEDIEIIPFSIKPNPTFLAGDEDIEIIPFSINPNPIILAGDEDIEIIPFFI